MGRLNSVYVPKFGCLAGASVPFRPAYSRVLNQTEFIISTGPISIEISGPLGLVFPVCLDADEETCAIAIQNIPSQT